MRLPSVLCRNSAGRCLCTACLIFAQYAWLSTRPAGLISPPRRTSRETPPCAWPSPRISCPLSSCCWLPRRASLAGSPSNPTVAPTEACMHCSNAWMHARPGMDVCQCPLRATPAGPARLGVSPAAGAACGPAFCGQAGKRCCVERGQGGQRKCGEQGRCGKHGCREMEQGLCLACLASHQEQP